ncbi:synaptobrevin-domain-containing protein [Calycina marina]|uniref:Synaptobrevin homolog YKT6 n=1 Tax=Calycina marina TaxID=1763456 RepID=A0A9P7Z1B5_9HELO|nr:synaptobrevin-domain-containing protein [Calycina marina]
MASSSSAQTPLLYACIAHNTTILSEHAASASSQTSSLASLVLPKITHENPQKLTYTHNSNFIHYIASSPSEYSEPEESAGGLTFLVVADSSLGRRIPFGFLIEIKARFLEKYPAETTDFASMDSYGAGSFNSEMKTLMVNFGTTKSGKQDAIQRAQGEIDITRGIMSQNIETLLERGERIDLLVDKTDRLGGSAHEFRVRSRGLRRQMWWKNVKLMVLLTVVVIFLVYLLIGFGCGLPGWSRCVGSGK